MGHNKIVMKKIEDPTFRKQFYSNRKDNIVKKSNELAVVCGTDVALLMFSPAGQETTYSSKESVEDIMIEAMKKSVNLRPIPNPNEHHLMQSLKQSKSEGQMDGKIAMYDTLLWDSVYMKQSISSSKRIHDFSLSLLFLAHEKKFNELKETLRESQQKIRHYHPQVENIIYVQEVESYEQFLRSNMEQIQQSKAKLLGVQGFVQRNEYPAVSTVDSAAPGTSSGWTF